jgi:hypothetical protein
VSECVSEGQLKWVQGRELTKTLPMEIGGGGEGAVGRGGGGPESRTEGDRETGRARAGGSRGEGGMEGGREGGREAGATGRETRL